MEIRILFCLLGLFGNALSLEVSYNGPELFPMNEEATLLCQISPTPNTPEGANNLAVWWSQVDLTTGTRTKLGKSSVDESYLYSSIPNGLNNRFTTSTDEFIYGIAKASIANVGIADDKTYQCEVEDLTTHDATDTQFKLNVYLEPDVQIYDEETNLDIRPIKQTEPTETATENPIYDDAIPDTPAPAAVNVNVSIAQCVATNAFPKPTKFEFVSDSTGNTWTVVNENEIMYVENADGTFNASAVLRIDPSAELDGAEISCRTWLYPSLSYASAGTTSPIVVKHMTNEATISLSTTEAVEGDRVSISCTANGNPPPTIELQDPAGNIHNVTGVNYVISRAQVEHAGVYVCHAYNDADATLATAEGTLSVEWVGNPRVKNNGNRIVNKLVEVTLGDSINIVCAAQGYPAPQITVVRGTQPLQGSTVTRNSVTYADAGSYSCKAATGNIVKITNFQVVVNGGCVVSLQKVVSSSMEDEDGAYVNLKCTATGHPACSMSMEPYGEYQPSSPGDNQLEMTIPDMKKQVSPVNFTCQASNSLGSHSATVILTDEAVCCVEPHKGGIGTGVVIIIILLVAVVLVGVPLAVYCYKKKESEKARSAKEEKELEADEGVKMNPGDEDG